MYGRVERSSGEVTVAFERFVAAPRERVFDVLGDPGLVARWLAPAEIELVPGGRVAVDFGPDGSVVGRILELDPPRRLTYTWLIDGEPESVVEWTLVEVPGGTRLELVHRSLPDAMAAGYGAGWHAHLDRLAAVVAAEPVPDWDARFAEVLDAYR